MFVDLFLFALRVWHCLRSVQTLFSPDAQARYVSSSGTSRPARPGVPSARPGAPTPGRPRIVGMDRFSGSTNHGAWQFAQMLVCLVLSYRLWIAGSSLWQHACRAYSLRVSSVFLCCPCSNARLRRGWLRLVRALCFSSVVRYVRTPLKAGARSWRAPARWQC